MIHARQTILGIIVEKEFKILPNEDYLTLYVRVEWNASRTSNSLSVTDTTPPRKQVTVNNMVRNCIFAIVTAVQVQVDMWSDRP